MQRFTTTLLACSLATIAATCSAQWDIQDSGTTASLRGIHSLGKGIAWASGTKGTVLRTEDAGFLWQHCTTPPDAETLDFRGIQAFDANTAIVMSSGKGFVSKIYKTTDGCQTWKLVFTNPDENGFFDSLRITQGKTLHVLGDPVNGIFPIFLSDDGGDTWFAAPEKGRDAPEGAGAFAASNSSILYLEPYEFFATGAGAAVPPRVYRTKPICAPSASNPKILTPNCAVGWVSSDLPLGITGSSAGVFSIAGRGNRGKDGLMRAVLVAVGGTYDKPAETAGTCAISRDGGETWQLPATSPHGYRSSVAYIEAAKTWIATGTNGTDISHDDGQHWNALQPSASELPDADKNWNALSLPFVVGPKGRIGVLRSDALKPVK